MGSTQPSIQWVLFFFLTADRPDLDGDHSPPFIAEVKNDWSYICVPPVCLNGLDKDKYTSLSLKSGGML